MMRLAVLTQFKNMTDRQKERFAAAYIMMLLHAFTMAMRIAVKNILKTMIYRISVSDLHYILKITPDCLIKLADT